MIKRAIYFIAGLFVMSLGVAFSIKSSLGTTPISSISYSLALCTGVNIGITTIVFNGALVFIQMLVLKKRFEAKRLLQFINCFLFGYFTDLAIYIVSLMNIPSSLAANIFILILSIFLTALGIFIYMPADIAPLPGEGCVESIAIVTDWRFSSIKIFFDASMIAVSLVLCGIFYTDIFGSVNIGTFLAAFFVGFTLRQIIKVHTLLTGKEINIR